MSCQQSSFEEVFQQNLATTTSYFMKGGRLFLTLNHGTGTMKFDLALGLANHGPGKATEDKENPK
jgi:hypothetical protein